MANQLQTPRPQWFKEYSFKADYKVADLSPYSLDALLVDFAKDRNLLTAYWQRVFKQGDPTLAGGCDNDCLVNELCYIVQTELAAPSPRCDSLLGIFHSYN